MNMTLYIIDKIFYTLGIVIKQNNNENFFWIILTFYYKSNYITAGSLYLHTDLLTSTNVFCITDRYKDAVFYIQFNYCYLILIHLGKTRFINYVSKYSIKEKGVVNNWIILHKSYTSVKHYTFIIILHGI